MVDGNEPAKSPAPDCYVKNDNKFFITADLEIFPSSKSLVLLKDLKVEHMSCPDSLDIHVGTEEVHPNICVFHIIHATNTTTGEQHIQSP